MRKKKIIAFAGSTSKNSINIQFLQHVVEKFNGFEIEFLDLNDYEMPIYSVDREIAGGVPQEAVSFREKMHSADAIIVSLAEHNAYITASLKNILDWGSRVSQTMEIFGNKPMFLMSVSTGRSGGKLALEAMKLLVEKRYKGDVLECFSLPSFNHTFAVNTLIDDTMREELEEKLNRFGQVVLAEKIEVE